MIIPFWIWLGVILVTAFVTAIVLNNWFGLAIGAFLAAFVLWLISAVVVVTPPVVADPPTNPAPTATPSSVAATAIPTAVPPVAQPPVGGPGGQLGGAGNAPQTVEAAAQVLGVNAPQLLTVLYPRPGDSTAIGWVLGTSASESTGTRVTARTVPTGVCVDYDHGSSTLNGPIARSQQLTGKWTRALMAGTGAFDGLKGTFYWTPCVFTSGSSPIITSQGAAPATLPTNRPSDDKSSRESRSMDDSRSSSTDGNTQCLKGTEDAARVIGGNAINWSVLPNTNGEGLKYKGPSVPLKAPNHGRVDTPSGELRNGEAGKAGEATYWCNG